MVCPYCSHKNTSTDTSCHQCGILIHLGRTSHLIPHHNGAGHGLSFVRTLLPGHRLKAQQTALEGQIEEAVQKIEHRAKEGLKSPDRAAAAQLSLGALYLLQGDIEKSLHWFQQARQTGSLEVEFFNNAGVTLARRGTLTQAAEMFEQAARRDPGALAPHANLGHLFVQAAPDPDPENASVALANIQHALTLEPENPTLYNRLALIYCREQRYEEAVAQFVHALKLAKNNDAVKADAENNTGLALCLCGDVATAEKAFDAALHLDPNYAPALTNQSLARMQDAVPDPELEKLGRAAHIDPKSAPVRADYGYGLCRIGAVNDGILELKEALAIDPHLFEACYNLGKTYIDYEALDIAERYLARALHFSPKSPEVLTALGVFKTQQKMLPQAVQYFQAALKIWPRSALAEVNLGIAQGLAGGYAEAGKHFKKAGDLDPKNPHIPAQIGWLHLMQGNLTPSLDALGVAGKMDANLPEVQNNYGVCYLGLGKPERALAHFQRALELKTDFYAVHYQLGCAYAALKNSEAALREWELTAKHEPTNVDCHVNRGVLFYQRGQFDEAVASFRHVISLRETRREDFSNLGIAYSKSGMLLQAAARNPQDPRSKQAIERHKKAIDMFDRALVSDPKNVMLHSNRGLACFAAGRAEQALQEWSLVTKLDPDYARRRGKKYQSEYDDTQIALLPCSVPARAASIRAKTGPYLPRFLTGYDTEEWDLILTDPALTRLSEMRRELRRLDRNLAALPIAK